MADIELRDDGAGGRYGKLDVPNWYPVRVDVAPLTCNECGSPATHIVECEIEIQVQSGYHLLTCDACEPVVVRACAKWVADTFGPKKASA